MTSRSLATPTTVPGIRGAAGEFTARKLTRDPRKAFDRKLELWLAPEYGYLPVRIRQTEANGDFADAQLRKPLPSGPPN